MGGLDVPRWIHQCELRASSAFRARAPSAALKVKVRERGLVLGSWPM